jgi:hypothetical protein
LVILAPKFLAIWPIACSKEIMVGFPFLNVGRHLASSRINASGGRMLNILKTPFLDCRWIAD